MAAIPLWRMCRVVANRARLNMLLLLRHRQRLRVSDVARKMKMSLPAASQYLRALEACGFVRMRRIRRAVVYELATNAQPKEVMTEALIRRLAGGEKAMESVFKLATAFANPGRIEVFRSLGTRPKSLIELKSEMAWSRWTLWRHLQKLESRGFVHRRKGEGTYERARVGDEFGHALAEAAAEASGQT